MGLGFGVGDVGVWVPNPKPKPHPNRDLRGLRGLREATLARAVVVGRNALHHGVRTRNLPRGEHNERRAVGGHLVKVRIRVIRVSVRVSVRVRVRDRARARVRVRLSRDALLAPLAHHLTRG